MTQSVAIRSGDPAIHALAGVDEISMALITHDTVHHHIHHGHAFTSGFSDEDLAAAASVELLVRVAATKTAHVRLNMASEATARVLLFEATTTSADGTPVARLNRNRGSATTATTLVFEGPTITGDGTELLNVLLPGGSGGNASGTSGTSAFEWILDPADYLVRLTNEDASAKDVTLQLNWYEPS